MEDSPEDKKQSNVVQAAFNAYLQLLKQRPILTKSITSGIIAGLGDIVAQKVVSKDPKPLTYRSTFAFAALGTFFTGPLSHYFYHWLEHTFPSSQQYYAIKRVVVDRFGFAPPYLLAFFYLLGILEGKGHAVSVQKIKEMYWTALKMNWKIWTFAQFINVNFVPLQFRVLFASCVAFIWTIYLALARRQ